MNLSFNLFSDFLTVKNEVLKKITKEDELFYLDYINHSLISVLNTYVPSSFSENLPEISEETATLIKKSIIQTNQNPELDPIIKAFINYIEPINLINLLNNIKSLKIIHEKISDKTNLGEYSIKNNTISIHSSKHFTLSHEFLHVASSKIINDIYISGFSIGNKYGTFFKGLNEGFTELFNQRIFNSKAISYIANVTICKCLELMFDNPKDLEKAYFNNDIDFLYQTFLTYGTKEEFAYLCKYLDYFSLISCEKDEYKNALNFLYEIISRKNEQEKLEKFQQIIESNKPESLKTKFKKYVKN